MAIEKLLPQNVEAEEGLLGSLMIDPEAIVRVAPLVKADDFYREAHRTVYQAMFDLFDSGGPADLITLCDELGRAGKLEDLGGSAWVGSLANNVPTSRHAIHYARIVEEHATRRRLIHAAGKIAGAGYDEGNADVALELAEQLIRDVARRRPERDSGGWAEIVDEMLGEFLDGMEGKALGMPSGYTRLDRHIVALRRKELAYVMARPKVGKTMFAQTVGIACAELCAAEKDGCVEWFTMEMSAVQLAKRVFASIAQMNSRVLRASFRRPDGTNDTARWRAIDDLAEASKRRLDGHLFIRDASYSVEQLYTHLRRAVMERNCRVAIVDYFGLLKRAGGTGKELRTERMTEISCQLKEIARDLDIPIWVMAQANREAAHRENARLQMTDFRDTGAGEQDADWMFALHCQADYEPERAFGNRSKGIAPDPMFAEFCELSVLLARDGEGGVIIPLRRRKHTTTLEDWPEGLAWPDDPARPGGDAPTQAPEEAED